MLDKVLELKQPLLKDTTMLANVNKSKDVLSTAGERYQESLVRISIVTDYHLMVAVKICRQVGWLFGYSKD